MDLRSILAPLPKLQIVKVIRIQLLILILLQILEVTFDASGSSDADNDTLSYSIDYGDGTTGTGSTSSHVYTTGNYTATVTVTDGNGGSDTASVTIDVSNDNPGNDTCDFGAPLNNALQTIRASYENIFVLGSNGPDVSSISRFTINWDLRNNGLYDFSFNLNTAPWYISLKDASQNFNSANPQISLAGSGISGLDGNYYVINDGDNFVLVADSYSIYFSNSGTAPNCQDVSKVGKELSFKIFPNPATNKILLVHELTLKQQKIMITDIAGKVIRSFEVKENINNLNLDISSLDSGLYMVRIMDRTGQSKSLKLFVK